jgi:hypothetical protein
MISWILAGVLAFQQPAPSAPTPTAAKLVSLMLARYAQAKTVFGNIRLVQTSQNVSLEIDTSLAMERPDLIYLHQVKPNSNKAPADLVSDGVQFAYTAIPSPLSPPKLIESVYPAQMPPQHVGEMYFCILPGLLDHSVPLDVVIGRRDHLALLITELAQFSLKGSSTLRGISVYEIAGDWKDAMRNQISGTFELYVTPAGDLVRFVRHHFFGVSPKYLMNNHLPFDAFPNGVPVDETWDADLTVDKPVNRSLFTLRQ